MDEYSVGEYIIYRNGEKYELGRIKSLREDGAFVAYHEAETGALTPYDHMHKLINRYCIKDTSLGGDYFKADTPQTDWKKEKSEKSLCNSCGKDCDNRKRNLYVVECNRYEPQTDCDTCRHYKLACELFSEICKYEPTTQIETQNSNEKFEKSDCPWKRYQVPRITR